MGLGYLLIYRTKAIKTAINMIGLLYMDFMAECDSNESHKALKIISKT